VNTVSNTFKKNFATLATAGAIGLAAIAAGSVAGNTHSVSAATKTVVTVKYQSIVVYDAPNGNRTSKWLGYHTSWKAFGTAKGSDGQTWYNLGGAQWVPASYVSLPSTSTATSSSAKINAVIALAKKQIGKPYVWGGKGPSSFDCSGLMHYVFLNAAKKEIGGWTVPQESAGTKVSISSLKAGDLIFWGSRGATYHVALYIGGGKYIEAPKPGQNVRTSTLSSYYMPSFGVRVFK
jgi:cell wall-associated NlpC family hydrolase